MVCPYCNAKSQVYNSRSSKSGVCVWRRRECSRCHAVWSTDEEYRYSSSHSVKYPNGTIKPFVREILYISVYDAINFRKNAVIEARDLADTIITNLLRSKRALISSGDIKKATLEVLKNFDRLAADLYQAKLDTNAS